MDPVETLDQSPPAPEAPTTQSAVNTPSAPTAPSGGVQHEVADPLDRRSVIAKAVADKKAESGDMSLRDRLIKEGKIRPAAPGDRPRNERGQFTPAQQAAAAAQAATQPQAAPPVQRPPLPKWLAKDLEPHWNQGPEPLLKAVLKYGDDANVGITKYKTVAQQHEALMNEFRPYEQILRSEGATPQTAMRSLLQTAAVLRTGTPEQKAQLVAQTIQQFGVPFQHIAQMFGVPMQDAQGNPIQTPQPDPALQALMREVTTLKSSIQSQQQAAQEAESARFAMVADQFGKDRPHFESLKIDIARILKAGMIKDAETKSDTELLQAAYDMALRLNPELYEQHLAQERERAAAAEREKANQAAAASRSAAVQVRGAPGPASLPAVDPKDRRSAIKHAIALHSR